MQIIAQRSLLCWKYTQDHGDLFRLEMVLDNLQDEEFMRFFKAMAAGYIKAGQRGRCAG